MNLYSTIFKLIPREKTIRTSQAINLYSTIFKLILKIITNRRINQEFIFYYI